VDLLLVRGESIIAIEIKSKISCQQSDLKSLRQAISMLNVRKAFVITLGEDEFPISEQVTALGFING